MMEDYSSIFLKAHVEHVWWIVMMEEYPSKFEEEHVEQVGVESMIDFMHAIDSQIYLLKHLILQAMGMCRIMVCQKVAN